MNPAVKYNKIKRIIDLPQTWISVSHKSMQLARPYTNECMEQHITPDLDKVKELINGTEAHLQLTILENGLRYTRVLDNEGNVLPSALEFYGIDQDCDCGHKGGHATFGPPKVISGMDAKNGFKLGTTRSFEKKFQIDGAKGSSTIHLNQPGSEYGSGLLFLYDVNIPINDEESLFYNLRVQEDHSDKNKNKVTIWSGRHYPKESNIIQRVSDRIDLEYNLNGILEKTTGKKNSFSSAAVWQDPELRWLIPKPKRPVQISENSWQTDGSDYGGWYRPNIRTDRGALAKIIKHFFGENIIDRRVDATATLDHMLDAACNDKIIQPEDVLRFKE
jgi:hypothetical protein